MEAEDASMSRSILYVLVAFGLGLPVACGDDSGDWSGDLGGAGGRHPGERSSGGSSPGKDSSSGGTDASTGGSRTKKVEPAGSGGGANGPPSLERDLTVSPADSDAYGPDVIGYKHEPNPTDPSGVPQGFGGTFSLVMGGSRWGAVRGMVGSTA